MLPSMKKEGKVESRAQRPTAKAMDNYSHAFEPNDDTVGFSWLDFTTDSYQ